MGFEHNDIVTTDVMNAAIAGGCGGGGDIYKTACTISGDITFEPWSEWDGQMSCSGQLNVYVDETLSYYCGCGGSLTLNGKTFTLPDTFRSVEYTEDLPEGITAINVDVGSSTDDDNHPIAYVIVGLGTDRAAGSEPVVAGSVSNIVVDTLSDKLATILNA